MAGDDGQLRVAAHQQLQAGRVQAVQRLLWTLDISSACQLLCSLHRKAGWENVTVEYVTRSFL